MTVACIPGWMAQNSGYVPDCVKTNSKDWPVASEPESHAPVDVVVWVPLVTLQRTRSPTRMLNAFGTNAKLSMPIVNV